MTDRQVASLRKIFAKNSSKDIKSSKTQISKILLSGGFRDRLLGPLLKVDLPLMKNVLKSLAKNVLIPLGLTSAASAADAGIHKKILGSGITKLIISNEEMKGIMNIVTSFEDLGLLIKGVPKTIENKTKEQNGAFLSMLLGTFGACLLGNMLVGKEVIEAGDGVIRAGQDF